MYVYIDVFNSLSYCGHPAPHCTNVTGGQSSLEMLVQKQIKDGLEGLWIIWVGDGILDSIILYILYLDIYFAKY